MSKNSYQLAAIILFLSVASNPSVFLCCADYPDIYTNTWLVEVPNVERNYVDHIARKHGFINKGPAGSIQGYYIFEHRAVRRSRRSNAHYARRLVGEPLVKYSEQQKLLRRVKRDFLFSDPLYNKQWYLNNIGQTPGPRGYDINVIPVWKKNITGKGVVVTILDDGIEYTHPDLKRSYDSKASYDYNSNDPDPFPRYTSSNINKHGTRCAGEIAGDINNGVCGVGVAYDAKVGGIRMLDGDVTDAIEGSSLSLQQSYIDIYSSSWGPDDDGKTVDGPGIHAQMAFKEGIRNGRGGLGSIFVWATGNGGNFNDYCNCDGYITSIYTISIGAVSDMGVSPWYAETCPSTLAVTYSSGVTNGKDLKIFTTDLHNKCTDSHTGTSAAAPLAAGIFALVLQANKNLSWRDLQHACVRTSKMTDSSDSDWQKNGANLFVNHKYGFGVLDTAALVDYVTSPEWKTVTDQHMCQEMGPPGEIAIPGESTMHSRLYSIGCILGNDCVTSIEHVVVYVTLSHLRRGSLIINLISPAGTRSKLLDIRKNDLSSAGFQNWAFMTVFNWGESPHGEWKLSITNTYRSTGRLKKWSLKVYGTCEKTKNISINESKLCRKECMQDCKSKIFHDECGPSCQSYCDCAIGKCVPECSVNGSDKDEDKRQCRPLTAEKTIPNGLSGLFSSQTKWLIMVAAFMATIVLIGETLES